MEAGAPVHEPADTGLLKHSRIAQQIREHDARTLDPGELSTLPPSIVECHRLLWAELPTRVRTAMRLAAMAMGASDDPATVITFVARIIDRATLTLEVREVKASLDDAVNPYEWFTRTDDILRFADRRSARDR